VLLQEVQLDPSGAGEGGLPSTDEHGMHEELALIDQPGVERVRRESRLADGNPFAGPRRHGGPVD